MFLKFNLHELKHLILKHSVQTSYYAACSWLCSIKTVDLDQLNPFVTFTATLTFVTYRTLCSLSSLSVYACRSLSFSNRQNSAQWCHVIFRYFMQYFAIYWQKPVFKIMLHCMYLGLPFALTLLLTTKDCIKYLKRSWRHRPDIPGWRNWDLHSSASSVVRGIQWVCYCASYC